MPSRSEKLNAKTGNIESEASKIIDKSITASMKYNYIHPHPFDHNKIKAAAEISQKEGTNRGKEALQFLYQYQRYGLKDSSRERTAPALFLKK